MSREKVSELGSTNQRSCRLWLRFRALADLGLDVHISEPHSSFPALGKATCLKGDMLVSMPEALHQGTLCVQA